MTGCSTTQFLFFPATGYLRTPTEIGIKYLPVSHQAADGTSLKSWYLPATGNTQGIVYFLHGNAQNISTHIASVYWLPAAGYDVFLLDYRGFGRSAGVAKIPAVFEDIESGFRWIQDHNPEQLSVFILAQSLGASLAVPFAARADIRPYINGLVIDAAFASYRDITRNTFAQHWLTWLFQYPAAWLISNPYDPIDYINKIAPTPLLIFHSPADRVIPYSNADKLLQQANEPKYFFEAKGQHIITPMHV
ncbi:MAG: alpha/beta fold hydrolase [Pseudomonadales bacterium]|nr:alpha/beta fold hydrolase [Pseudomonadales bacterium]